MSFEFGGSKWMKLNPVIGHYKLSSLYKTLAHGQISILPMDRKSLLRLLEVDLIALAELARF